MAALSLVAAISGIYGPIWPTWPEIQPSGNDPGSPFSLPFTVTNKSEVFPLMGAKFICHFTKIETFGNLFYGSDLATQIGPPKAVQPGEMQNFSCGIGLPAHTVKSVRLEIIATYRWSFVFLTRDESDTVGPFNWVRTTDGGRWIKGEER
jgi:hypothetical protein